MIVINFGIESCAVGIDGGPIKAFGQSTVHGFIEVRLRAVELEVHVEVGLDLASAEKRQVLVALA